MKKKDAHILSVRSLPLKDVIKDLASELGTDYNEICKEYILDIPQKWGIGEIRGINFDNGLGIILYKCRFAEDISIKFEVNHVHPIKYIYAAESEVRHSFSNQKEVHSICQYMNAIVASQDHNGHILHFDGDKDYTILSLEIDRDKFIQNLSCEIQTIDTELLKLFNDVKAESTFYHEGFFGVEFLRLIQSIDRYDGKHLLRKLYLESVALELFVKQVELFEDDKRSDSERNILRYPELDAIRQVENLIMSNLDKNFTNAELSKESGLNLTKLQDGFRRLYNTTIRDYTNKRKMEYAKYLLTHTTDTMTSIAAQVGINSTSYFTRLFKKTFYMNPSTYRENYINENT